MFRSWPRLALSGPSVRARLSSSPVVSRFGGAVAFGGRRSPDGGCAALDWLFGQADAEYVECVADDLRRYADSEPKRSVLVFPPVSNFRRFLIHNSCERLLGDRGYATFSIGQGDLRRTVVCHESQILSRFLEDTKKATMVIGRATPPTTPHNGGEGGGSGGEKSGLYRPPQARMQSNRQQQQQQQQPQSQRETSSRVRRPDRAVYVPKARRTTSNPPDPQQPPSIDEKPQSSEAKSKKLPKNNNNNTTAKKAHDKSFCNAYKPPHSRLPDSQSSEFSESLPRTSPERVLRQEGEEEVIRSDSSESQGVSSLNQLDILSNAEESSSPASNEGIVDSDISLDPNLYSENVAGCATAALATIERPHNFAVDIAERVEDYHVENDFNRHDHELSMENAKNSENDQKIDEDFTSDDIFHDVDSNAWNFEKEDDTVQSELIKASEEINRSNRRLIKQSFVSDVLVISPRDGEPEKNEPPHLVERSPSPKQSEDDGKPNGKAYNPDEQDWESMFDENGDWLEPELLDELTNAVGRVAVQKPRASYSNYLETAPRGGFSHVLEVYNFPAEFTSNDLLNVFVDFKDSGFEIKWVNDNHALAVFSSAEIAAQVLSYNHPMVKTRPLHEATIESRTKAKKSAEFLKPYKPRPETCTALARRLVSGALGVKLPNQAQERLAEKQKISLAREKKRLAAMHREAAWNGSLTSDTHSS